MVHDLYQEIILDHSKRPRNCHSMDDATRQADGYNPLCGDKLKLYLKMEDDIVKDVSFVGSGCAISKASASMMTQALKGKRTEEAEGLFEEFHSIVTGKRAANTQVLGKLAVFSGVSEFPVRVKCATLAWHALHAALHGQEQPVSTE